MTKAQRKTLRVTTKVTKETMELLSTVIEQCLAAMDNLKIDGLSELIVGLRETEKAARCLTAHSDGVIMVLFGTFEDGDRFAIELDEKVIPEPYRSFVIAHKSKIVSSPQLVLTPYELFSYLPFICEEFDSRSIKEEVALVSDEGEIIDIITPCNSLQRYH